MIEQDDDRKAAEGSFSEASFVKLCKFVEMLQKWNSAINLVSQSSLEQVWGRHILDSEQVFRSVAVKPGLWADFGSGAGFPAVVVAIMAYEVMPQLSMVLVESDRRKAEFLRAVSRETDVPMTVLADRIERLAPLGADFVSARALAPLPQLCAFADRHLRRDGIAVFPKGVTAADEVAAARQSWSFDLETLPSRTEATASILLLRDIAHV